VKRRGWKGHDFSRARRRSKGVGSSRYGRLFLKRSRRPGCRPGGHSIEMPQRFLHCQRIHFSPQAFSGLTRSFQIVASDLHGQRIRNDTPGALLIFPPGGMRQSYPNRPAVHQKLDVDGVGMARSNGYNECLIDAVQVALAPAIDNMEVLIHGKTIQGAGKPPQCKRRARPWGFASLSRNVRFLFERGNA